MRVKIESGKSNVNRTSRIRLRLTITPSSRNPTQKSLKRSPSAKVSSSERREKYSHRRKPLRISAASKVAAIEKIVPDILTPECQQTLHQSKANERCKQTRPLGNRDPGGNIPEVDHGKKSPDAGDPPESIDASPRYSRRPGLPTLFLLAQHRKRDADCEQKTINQARAELPPQGFEVAIDKRTPRLEHVIVHVAEKGRGKNRGHDAQRRPGAKVTEIRREEEKFNHQFLEIVVITVPKVDDRFSQQRLVSVAEYVEAEQTHDPYPGVALGGQEQGFPNQVAVKAGPGYDQRGSGVAVEDLLDAGNPEIVAAEQRREWTLRIAVNYRGHNLQQRFPQQNEHE